MKEIAFDAASFLLLRAAALVALWMVGDKDPRGWRLGLAVQVGFLFWALGTGALALVPLSVLSLALHARNLWEWRKPEGRPTVLRLEAELAESAARYAALLDRFEARVEHDGQIRHDRAKYTRRLNTYAHALHDQARAAGLDCPPVPEPPIDHGQA